MIHFSIKKVNIMWKKWLNDNFHFLECTRATNQCAAADSHEAGLDQAPLTLGRRGWGPGAQEQGRRSWSRPTGCGQLLLLLLLAESLDLLWRHRDGLTMTMREDTDRGSGGRGDRHPNPESKEHKHTERSAETEREFCIQSPPHSFSPVKGKQK